MKKPAFFLLIAIVLSIASFSQIVAGRMKEVFMKTDLATNLNNPWEITYGPDGFLWITESRGYRIYRMNPATGIRTTVLNISQTGTTLTSAERLLFNLQFDFAARGNPQGGLAGLAIHPNFASNGYVYISYIHKYVSTASNSAGVFFINNIVRLTYNTGTGRLGSPVSLCDTIPGSSDHNSQRMIIAPVGGTNYLFYAAGDMGSGQFGNRNRPQNAQKTESYEGKILRFNLEEDSLEGAYDKWIPNDNPYNTTSPDKQSAVWSTGIRNNQGFAYDAANDILYGSSHGPYSDDEINVIESTRNYGHPLVIGYSADENYNGSSAGANNGSTCPVIVSEVTNANNIGSAYKDALFSGYPRTQSEINNIYSNNPGNGGWPSEGWSGLDIYKHTIIPGWKNSLLAASLKWGRLVRLKLGNAGTTIIPTDGFDTVSYFGSTNRFRDIAISPNGKDLYVIMDQSSTTSGPSAGNPIVPACAGCVQRYTFLGYETNNNKSGIPASIDITAGTPDACTSGSTIVINNTNNNLWVPITGSDGNIMAEIKANGYNLDTVNSSFFVKAGAVREDASKRLYLNRSITINPKVQPGGAVSIRLYLTNNELASLMAGTTSQGQVSGVNSISDLRIRKNNNASCTPLTNVGTTTIIPTYAEPHSTGGYVLQANISSFSSFYFGNPDAITLPLDLVYFKGSLQSDAVLLQWQTANEYNTENFIIERSSNGVNFEKIGTIAANGNSTNNASYTYNDNEAAGQSSSLLYYRLKMTDIDGGYTYSSIVTISFADITGRVTVSPNPIGGVAKVTIIAPLDGKAQWKIVDNTGRVVLQHSAHLKKGNNNLFINVNRLSAGLYYLGISGAGIDQNVKLQKL